MTGAVFAVPYDDGAGGANPQPTGHTKLEPRASNLGYSLGVIIWSSTVCTDTNLFDMLQPHNIQSILVVEICSNAEFFEFLIMTSDGRIGSSPKQHLRSIPGAAIQESVLVRPLF
ncbi:uncharacterized protein EV420DRAFT_1648452 [Desarmillaria tabescens]|uniref:Uncharacterized protein n=1 Tax=Armillaria tabescens TaxID=1929756 RepID=A0AA39JNY0_ARMTA|nr:uncharacterized protein EV420DRAFT_1648452 [Desarmillaria tabescens]KAK0445320.1 hypothetical protein EV420DRAFT_1648452 [Desarmillaria tabescens]